MKLFSTKMLRAVLERALFFLPRSFRASVDRRIRGRKEFRKLKQADFVVVSLAKSGRTWLRVMLSRYFQRKFDLPEHSIIGFDNFYTLNRAAPRALFSHDNVLRAYSGNLDSKKDFYNKKTILLVRDPRDLIVSQFHQWRYRMTPSKRRLHWELDVDSDIDVFDFAVNSDYGLMRGIRFLNDWQKELHKMNDVLVVKYEDLRANPGRMMGEILSFVGESATSEAVQDVVEYAKFENMRKLEEQQSFRTDSKRLFADGAADPTTFKTRRAKVGGYADYLTPEQIQIINNMIRDELAPEFGYNSNDKEAA